ncbi:MAG: hypothetical protein PHU12_04340 [Candidatus Aenigmarchaeota archaeon]|nr:hypothetical protein [Candidatus Aenigmarchaeota archaeon]
MGSGMHIETKKNILKVLEVLRNAQGELHLRGIARALGLNPGVVAHILDKYLQNFVEMRDVELYGFTAKLIRLQPGKENTTLTDVINDYKLRKRIKNRS